MKNPLVKKLPPALGSATFPRKVLTHTSHQREMTTRILGKDCACEVQDGLTCCPSVHVEETAEASSSATEKLVLGRP